MSQNVKLSAILFDMDGVLVDVSRSYRRAIEETVEHFTGRKIGANTVQRYKNYGGFNDDWKLTHAIITDTAMEVPLSRVIEEFQNRYRGENWDGVITEETPLISEASLQTLNTEERIMGIVTGRPEEEAEWTLDHFGWKKYFPLLVGKEKQGERPKPHPFPLNHSLTILAAAGRDVSPKESVYIGDSVDDMEAARKAGMWAVGIVPPYVDEDEHEPLLRERGAHLVLQDPNELPDLFNRFGEALAAHSHA
ncbi:MAG: TIGR01548 family HAD-type hydrolase [Bacteroidetes bacterium]|jgi:HAD superfamily phosphatase|nr:TIGR01548 family HAD-type hydrolase [Bacteroidota bacterium]